MHDLCRVSLQYGWIDRIHAKTTANVQKLSKWQYLTRLNYIAIFFKFIAHHEYVQLYNSANVSARIMEQIKAQGLQPAFHD